MLIKYVFLLGLVALVYGGAISNYYTAEEDDLQLEYITLDEPLRFYIQQYEDPDEDNLVVRRQREKREASPRKRMGRERGRGKKYTQWKD